MKHLIAEDGIEGVTSNPAIFERAIAGSSDYDEEIRTLALADTNAEQIYEALVIRDVQGAAGEFWSLYDASGGQAGFVSLEVDPHLARMTGETICEARRLWKRLNRPNVFIKIPATRAGLPAIRQLISEGINVNVTLLFGLPRYREVAGAFLEGLEERASRGEALDQVRSVASFFLSRIDAMVDPLLDNHPENPGAARQLRGKVAIASARVAYQIYLDITGSGPWKRLEKFGARPQRLLWASTRAKSPQQGELKYVEPLIGEDTITTMPMATLDAYRARGRPARRLEDGVGEARRVLDQLARLGIQIDPVTQQLEDEGIEKFNRPFENLIRTIKQRAAPFYQETAEREHLELS